MTADVASPALADDRKARRNVFVLAAAGALGGAPPIVIFATAPIAAYDLLGEDKSLATLPITASSSALPAARFRRRS